jgi:transitional endoplasmic reticulum ATPase
LAKAVANESEANYISVKGPEILSKWVGESEKAIREIFKKAKQASPSIVFLDEIDAITPRRGMSSDSHVTERIVNQLLTSIDGLESMEGVVVLAATNRPDIVDNALLRAGRFDRMMLIPAPDKEARLAIFKIHTKEMPLDDSVNLNELAEKSEGFVGADIESLCREAGILALRDSMEAEKVTMKHFRRALERQRPSVDEETIKFYEAMGEELEGGLQKRTIEDASKTGYM